jgi:hypothetical protein
VADSQKKYGKIIVVPDLGVICEGTILFRNNERIPSGRSRRFNWFCGCLLKIQGVSREAVWGSIVSVPEGQTKVVAGSGFFIYRRYLTSEYCSIKER